MIGSQLSFQNIRHSMVDKICTSSDIHYHRSLNSYPTETTGSRMLPEKKTLITAEHKMFVKYVNGPFIESSRPEQCKYVLLEA